ncbi:MAG: LL-diaminopimelate aminotransferase [Chloroflexota bacterium]|nr:LL-diaminopimelate aminotransferase [Chloroflexota bacterium]
MKIAKRIEKLPPYLFVGISKKIAEKRAQGIDVISLGIGDPDIPTPQHIIDRLCEASRDPQNHCYPESEGLPEFRRAVAGWYKRRFDIDLDSEKEIVSLIGAKEGVGHIALCFIDPGDIALVPDPAYPVYSIGTMFCGGESYYMPLLEENGFLPDLEAISSDVARKAKVLWISYPNNPTGAVAGIDFFEKVVEFAKKYDIAVCHDAPYTEIAFDGYKPVSFLEAKGALDVGVEFHSLSKTYNMTGWRVGMAVGNAGMVDALRRVKSNLDSGLPQAIQHAAIEALSGSQQCVTDNVAIYQRRRDRVLETLSNIGIKATPPRASLYIWARVPDGYTSVDFATRLLDELAVVVTPGVGYGPSGEGYIRISLTTPDDRLEEALARISAWQR